MPKITAINFQKNKRKVNVYLDGKVSSKGQPISGWGFGVDLEYFVKLGLKVGQVLTEDEVEKIIKESEFQKVYDKILRFGALRPRSEKEYKDWLGKHKIHKSLHSQLFNRLKQLDFLNDRKFAVWWVDQRIRFKSKSRRELVHELRIKGIKKDLVDEVLNQASIDEYSQAKKILQKKRYMWQHLSGYDARVKISQYLLRRGFNWDTIKTIVKKIDEKSFEV